MDIAPTFVSLVGETPPEYTAAALAVIGLLFDVVLGGPLGLAATVLLVAVAAASTVLACVASFMPNPRLPQRFCACYGSPGCWSVCRSNIYARGVRSRAGCCPLRLYHWLSRVSAS